MRWQISYNLKAVYSWANRPNHSPGKWCAVSRKKTPRV